MKTFKIDPDPNECGILFSHNKVHIKQGITVLVGCNGYGKSTFIKSIKHQLENHDIPFMSFDNLLEGHDKSRSRALFYGDMNFIASSIISSEGENTMLNMGNFASQIISFIRKNDSSDEYWFLLDAIDSGLSIDNVIEVKNLFNLVIKDNPQKNIYIVTSANEYEMCEGTNCYDVYCDEYITFEDYEGYRTFIIGTRQRKDQRKNDQKD